MSHKALKMNCPHCDTYSSCKTCETDPKHYCWDDDLAEMLKENSSKDISYRKRKKYCEKCEKHFYTAEMRHVDLIALIDLIKAKEEREEKNVYKELYENATIEIQRLKEKDQNHAKEKQEFTETIRKAFDKFL